MSRKKRIRKKVDPITGKPSTADNAISYNASNSSNQFWYLWFDVTASRGSALDFGAGGADEGKLIHIWVQPQFPIQSTGNYAGECGLGVMLGSLGTAAANTAQWTFYGSENLPGGFVRLVLDPRKIPSASGGFFVITSVDYVGVCMSISSTRNGVAAVYMDAMDLGSGLIYTGDGVGDGFQELLDYDEGDSTNRYGIIEALEGTQTVLGLRGSVVVGSGNTLTDFTSNGKVIAFDPPKYFNNVGAYVNSVDSDFYKISFENAGTGITNVQLGTSVSEGDDLTGRDGVIFLANEDYNYSFDVGTGLDQLNVYGCTIRNFANPIEWNGATTSELAGTFFDNNGQVSIDKDTIVRNCSFLNSDSGLLFTSGQDIVNCSFISNTYGIEHPESGEFTYNALTFSANTTDILYSETGLGDLTINATNGSNPTTAETGNPSNTVDTINAVTLTLEDVVANSEVRFYTSGTKTERYGVENSPDDGDGFGNVDFSYQFGDPGVDIRIFHLDYQPLNLFARTLGSTNASIPIQQIPDRNYENP